MLQNNKLRKNQILRIIILAVIAILFLLTTSTTTSPIYGHYYGKDSEIFRMMGRLFSRGYTPYTDFFDHKGPVIIIIQYIACLISEEKIGIFAVQIVFLTLTIVAMDKLLALAYTGWKKNVALAILILIIRMFFDGGNLTEEYCLPFLVFSFYLAACEVFKKNRETLGKNKKLNCEGAGAFDKDERIDSEGNDALAVRENIFVKDNYSILAYVFYGITFGICAYTRLTNAFPLCCLIIALEIKKLNKVNWKNQLIKDLCAFTVGAVAIMVPIGIYLWQKGALYEMLYACFIYNFRHATDFTQIESMEELLKLIACAFFLIGCVILGFIGLVTRDRRLRYSSVTMIFMASVALIFHFTMRFYLHYYMIYIPILAYGLLLTKEVWESFKARKHHGTAKRNTIIFLALAGIAIIAIKNTDITIDEIKIYKNRENYSAIVKQQKDIVAGIDRNEGVIAYNISASFYINTDIDPVYRNFVFQDLHTEDERIREGFESDLKSLQAKYIVTSKSDQGKYIEFIKKNYTAKKENKLFILYCRK